MALTKQTGPVVAWSAGLLAGAGAGVVAALTSVFAGALMRASLPPVVPAAGSAFVAGLLGGLLYAWLSRVVSRPRLVFWIVALSLATIDSIFIATLGLPEVVETPPGVPIYGLLVPLGQLAALLGIGRLGQEHFPRAFLPADAVMHYVTATAIALLVPFWAGRPRRM